jgi:hypothetical protein
VLLLELITGRRAIDTSRPDGEQSLVAWAATLLKTEQEKLVDPRLVMAMQRPSCACRNSPRPDRSWQTSSPRSPSSPRRPILLLHHRPADDHDWNFLLHVFIFFSFLLMML